MIIRANTFEQWLKANLDKGNLRDLAKYGASQGFPGLTYYQNTVVLYDKFHDEIWDLLWQQAKGMGFRCPLKLIASFNGAQDISTDIQFKNLLVWHMAEETARRLISEY